MEKHPLLRSKGRIAPITQCVKAFENARSHLIKKSQKTDLCDMGFLIKHCKLLEGKVCCGLSDFCSPCVQCPSTGLAHSTPADLKNSLDDGYLGPQASLTHQHGVIL